MAASVNLRDCAVGALFREAWDSRDFWDFGDMRSCSPQSPKSLESQASLDEPPGDSVVGPGAAVGMWESRAVLPRQRRKRRRRLHPCSKICEIWGFLGTASKQAAAVNRGSDAFHPQIAQISQMAA